MKKFFGKLKKLNVTVWIFIVFIGVFALLNIINPDRQFSENENRMLTQFPKLSAKALFLDDTKWTLKFEDYFTDQFVLRDEWIGLRAVSEKAVQKKENKGVYFAKDDYLIAHPVNYSQDTIDINVKNINEFAANTDTKVSFALVPNSICINSSLLPKHADDGSQKQIISSVYGGLKGINTIDITTVLEENSSEQLYYRTDHHPTSLGAYHIYSALSSGLSFDANAQDSYTVETISGSFSGTARNTCGAWWVEPDTIQTYTLPGENLTMTISDGRGEEQEFSSPYVLENLDVTDQYTVFAGGNAPLHILNNPNGEANLLIIMDSFSHTISPFLASHYSEVHLLDLRYYRLSVKEYMQGNNIDEVLIMFSVNNFITEKNFVFLNG